MSHSSPREPEAPESEAPEPNGEPDAPTFRALLLANLRVVAWAIGLAAICFGVWRALKGLFPDVSWLQ